MTTNSTVRFSGTPFDCYLILVLSSADLGREILL
jgi:hypothetical protein